MVTSIGHAVTLTLVLLKSVCVVTPQPEYSNTIYYTDYLTDVVTVNDTAILYSSTAVNVLSLPPGLYCPVLLHHCVHRTKVRHEENRKN